MSENFCVCYIIYVCTIFLRVCDIFCVCTIFFACVRYFLRVCDIFCVCAIVHESPDHHCFGVKLHRLYKRRNVKFSFSQKRGMLRYREIDEKFSEIWRVFISGSSSAGKTHFARQLLESNFFKYKRIYYFHPDIQENCPVDWDDYLKVPVLCQAGLPSNDEMLDMPAYSVIILDDLFTEACKDKTMSYLFRVLSGKKKLHVIIMTQRYYAEGSNGLNIRNSSNFHVLMNNADEHTNLRVGYSMNLASDVKKAIEINKKKLYPYIFINRNNTARVSGLQIYTDIFSKSKQVIVNSMPHYLISEPDFKSKFAILDKNTAVKHGVNKKNKSTIKNKQISRQENKAKSSSSDTSSSDSTSDFTSSEDERERYSGNKFAKNLPRRSINSKLQRQDN